MQGNFESDNSLSAPLGADNFVSAPLRSLLFVPGSRPERFAKALSAGADAMIIDLEDAVAPQDKEAARAAVLDFLTGHRPMADSPKVLVRINGIRSRTGMADLFALTASARPGWDGLLLPKVDGPGDVRQVADIVAEAGCPGFLGALVESAEGLENVMAIAAAARSLKFLMFGGADLSAELGVALDWEPLVHARARIVHAARRFGLDAVEMPWVRLDDEDGYAIDIKRSFSLGFTARAAIHPKQVAAIHAALTPDPQAVDAARRVVAAFAASAGAVCQLDGRMVERPLVLASQRILGLASRAQAPSGRV